MRIRLVAIVVLAGIVAGCGSDDRKALPSPSSAVATVPLAAGTTTPATVLATAPQTTAAPTGMISEASAMACDSDLKVLEVAVEAYLALYGTAEVTEADLVSAQFIREQSSNYDIAAGGAIVPVAGGRCAG